MSWQPPPIKSGDRTSTAASAGSNTTATTVGRATLPMRATSHNVKENPGGRSVGGVGGVAGIVERTPTAPRQISTLPGVERPPSTEREEENQLPLRAPVGGMVLDAPGVLSSVTERTVRAPAPMRMSVGGGGGRGHESVKEAKGRLSVPRLGMGCVVGGFPAVRHRSEMGLVRLGGAGARKRSDVTMGV